ncbi:hypothetical protein RSOLAG1IB_07773 [Rhizoctonia solani AG-1 IB]|uniref:Uncharacterized protein n=1 Tax=Thanatephorus cucumeris (strain AG1-IB / isolate 7/3/14) TaxID=1108050 RepID=A0A0B7FJN6_THACB|nr:hypothetical protein RSOLAG1IB_07773 [Rhizoctonia solani AG-1 IB]
MYLAHHQPRSRAVETPNIHHAHSKPHIRRSFLRKTTGLPSISFVLEAFLFDLESGHICLSMVHSTSIYVAIGGIAPQRSCYVELISYTSFPIFSYVFPSDTSSSNTLLTFKVA